MSFYVFFVKPSSVTGVCLCCGRMTHDMCTSVIEVVYGATDSDGETNLADKYCDLLTVLDVIKTVSVTDMFGHRAGLSWVSYDSTTTTKWGSGLMAT